MIKSSNKRVRAAKKMSKTMTKSIVQRAQASLPKINKRNTK